MNELYRVYNKCKYDIGVTTTAGREMNIRSGSFQLLSADDIAYIESLCMVNKFFAKKMLVAVGADGKEIPFEEIGITKDPGEAEHLDDAEIEAGLKLPIRKFEAWVEKIEDPTELHAVYTVAKKMDLPASKLRILKTKMPNKEWLDE